MMRFNIIWLDDEGFAKYAEHFEHPSLDQAFRFVSGKIARKTIDPGTCGFLLTYADSAFIQRYTQAPGSARKRLTERIETELACADLPHLLRPSE